MTGIIESTSAPIVGIEPPEYYITFSVIDNSVATVRAESTIMKIPPGFKIVNTEDITKSLVHVIASALPEEDRRSDVFIQINQILPNNIF